MREVWLASSHQGEGERYHDFMADYTVIGYEEVEWYGDRLLFVWVFMLCYTFVSAGVGIARGTCKSGTPDFLYYSIGSIMVVSLFGQLCRFIGAATSRVSTMLLVMFILLGLADMLDFFTDGQQI